MVMSRVVGNGQEVTQEVGGVMDVMNGFSHGAFSKKTERGELGMRRSRGESILVDLVCGRR